MSEEKRVRSVLYTKATASCQQSVEEDLQVEDPVEEKSVAKLLEEQTND